MKGLSVRIILAIGLLLWAIDMVFPWQKIMRSDDNLYSSIQKRQELVVGTINNAFSYFVNPNGAAGLEYELTKAFADYLGVQLTIQTFDNSEELLQALEENQIDLAAANLMYQTDKAERFQIGPSYYSASWQLVYRKNSARPYDLSQLSGKLLIPNNPDLQKKLSQLKQQYPQLEWQVDHNMSPEETLLAVADGKADYTIASSIDVASIQQVKPNLAVGFDLTEETSVNWYLPQNPYNELQTALLDFMNSAKESGLISRIEEKYFSHLSRFDYVDARTYISAIENTLPTYLTLFQRYADQLDWKLLAAISYQESHWDANATSPTGVRGIMMLTKETANRMKIDDRNDPEQSIKAGSEYLHMLLSKMPETIPEEDKIWFALVAYNLGLGHLLDVRRLTESLGGDPNNWLDVKAKLPLLADKKYYSKLKFGYARGYEAYQYVENIRRYHNSIINYYRIQEQTQVNDSPAETNLPEVSQNPL
ncbi:membrane-bound lytic murein transglycosylase MltF [Gallibacterium salpingitidis]|uniref:Membrane-bound lytic murein transglycosylase F n=1 Tax=Gallibacterium salpingitidis TaxID=505341 RepID=A0A1A7P1Y9_9PAST|nr:membrane-bound lytic murein transglycosylase MltF [Gallibacterium salpingitidis]OBW95840.1 murein transglycosylase [Gallibacterium salpingitidis]